MMSDQDMGKKEIEREELVPFLEAREMVTGERLSAVLWPPIESPDFLCVRRDGSVVGVELTKVTKNHEIAVMDRIRYGEARIDAFETLELLHHLIERKDEDRSRRYVEKADEHILVLQLVDGSLDQFAWALDGLQAEFASHGFSEVWIAEYSGLEAYSDLELFGLYPAQWWGRHVPLGRNPKPYA